MTQTLWYLRHDDRILGPFPAPQVAEFIRTGEVEPQWEISLDGLDWLTIHESGQFDEAILQTRLINKIDRKPEFRPWREERQRARQRWQGDTELMADAPSQDPAHVASLRRAISDDQLRTDALLQAERRRSSSMIPLLLGAIVLAIGGGVIWLGQERDGVQAGISAVPDCAAPAKPGVNWSGCDKRGLDLHRLQARNARLGKIRLDNARLDGADLTYALLTGASLRNVELAGAVLTGAELSNANLSGANLAQARMEYAVLKGAVIAGTRFDGARLDKATWVDGRVCAEGSLGTCR